MSKGSVALITLGCAKNTVDTEVMHARLMGAGWTLADDPAQADVTLVNTCGFIGPAREESIDTILEVARAQQGNPEKKLVVTGCMVTRYAEELWTEIPEIDLLVDLASFGRIDRLLDDALDAGVRRRHQGGEVYLYQGSEHGNRLTLPHTTYVKIAEGCNHVCAFCAIPSFKGRYRSRSVSDVVSEARMLVGQRVRELNIISQDTSFYGVDRDGGRMLPELLRALESEVEGDYWIRLLYLYPTEVDDALIEEMARNPRVVPYADIPLQHADPGILRAMGRGQDAARLGELLRRIRATIPGVALRTTLIVGFPGEGEEELRRLEDFVDTTRFDHLGVFTYSREEGTPAYPLGDPLPEALKQERMDRIMARQERISAELNAARVGSRMEVLVDGVQEGVAIARAPIHAPEVDGHVRLLPTDAGALPEAGEMVSVEIVDSDIYDLDAIALE